jgi:uncharacterized protein (TIGR03118 family)
VTGLSTLYSIKNAGGVVTASIVPLVVTIPAAAGGVGSPTGIVAPETPKGVNDFLINGKAAIFIFATLDGTISGFTGSTTATIEVDRSKSGATYSGLAIATNNGHKMLYAADDGTNRKIDVFDSSFQPVDLGPDAFVNPDVPQKFAPYGIQTITAADGSQPIWVTYTGLNKAQSGTKLVGSARHGCAMIGAVQHSDDYDFSSRRRSRHSATGSATSGPLPSDGRRVRAPSSVVSQPLRGLGVCTATR